MICASKKGVSSNQLHRTLGITLKSAWFMSHRIREAMKQNGTEPLGGLGKHIEADETYIGNKKGYDKARSTAHHKHAVFSLVERGGQARSFHVDKVTAAKLDGIMRANASTDSGGRSIHRCPRKRCPGYVGRRWASRSRAGIKS